MTLIAMCSAKGSPGVTTTSLAMLLTASRPTLYAELDAAGGDLLAGYLGGRQAADRGLFKLAVADHRGAMLDTFWDQLLDMDPANPGIRFALPGLTDPAQAGSLMWDRLGALLVGLGAGAQPYDVIADCGRLVAPNTAWPILYRAEIVTLVTRPTTVALRAAAVMVGTLRRELREHGSGDHTLTLAIVGDGEHSARAIEDKLGVPVVGKIPHDAPTATALTSGGRFQRKAALLRAGHTLSDELARRAAALAARPNASSPEAIHAR